MPKLRRMLLCGHLVFCRQISICSEESQHVCRIGIAEDDVLLQFSDLEQNMAQSRVGRSQPINQSSVIRSNKQQTYSSLNSSLSSGPESIRPRITSFQRQPRLSNAHSRVALQGSQRPLRAVHACQTACARMALRSHDGHMHTQLRRLLPATDSRMTQRFDAYAIVCAFVSINMMMCTREGST